MADTKITALAELASAASTDILPIVDDPGGVPITKKITVGNLLNFEFGTLYCTGGGATQALAATTWTKITQFTADGASSGGITPAHATDTITLADAGTYWCAFQCSFTGDNLATYNVAPYLDGVRQDQIQFTRKLGTGSDVGSASAVGLLIEAAGSVDVDLRVYCDGAKDFDIKEAQLVLVKVST